MFQHDINILLFAYFLAAYCDEPSIYKTDKVQPSSKIVYGEKYTLSCTLSNGDMVNMQRACGYNRFTGLYVTVGDEMVCPGMSWLLMVLLKCHLSNLLYWNQSSATILSLSLSLSCNHKHVVNKGKR